MNELKFAARQLLKNPGFTIAAALTLGICLGANARDVASQEPSNAAPNLTLS